jgi:hypothetical protein
MESCSSFPLSFSISVPSSPTSNEMRQGGGDNKEKGLSLPMLGDRHMEDKNREIMRSVSFEKLRDENNERVVLNVGGKRFETYLL